MEICLRLWLSENLVPRVWTSNSDKKIILRGDVTYDIAFTFAPILAPYQYVNASSGAARVKSQQCGRTYNYR